MKREWSSEELAEHWSFLFEEEELLTRRVGRNRRGFAILFKYFQNASRFPTRAQDVPLGVINYIAAQVDLPSSLWKQFDLSSRTARNYQNEIRLLFGFRECDKNDLDSLSQGG